MWYAYVTRIYRGRPDESEAERVAFDGYRLQFPPSHLGQLRWIIYLPMHGFEATGPWYQFPYGVDEASIARTKDRTCVMSYRDGDLSPRMVPTIEPEHYDVQFPEGFFDMSPDMLEAQRMMNAMMEELERQVQLSVWAPWLRPFKDPEWPDMLYEKPEDWFDDNQVID